MPFDVGDTVPLAVTITDAAGAPTVPTSVALTITGPAGAVGSTTPSNPSTGRYEFDFVPLAPGLYRVRWSSTGPATAYDDVVDVQPATGSSVVSLADAKQHLNKALQGTVDDEELRPMLAAAVRRVDRHLWTREQRDAGATLNVATHLEPEQRLAVLAVLAEYWRTQRARGGGRGGGGGTTAAAIAEDSGPGGMASLKSRLTDLLGPPAPEDNAAAVTAGAPRGCFPAAEPWPDPALVRAMGRWSS